MCCRSAGAARLRSSRSTNRKRRTHLRGRCLCVRAPLNSKRDSNEEAEPERGPYDDHLRKALAKAGGAESSMSTSATTTSEPMSCHMTVATGMNFSASSVAHSTKKVDAEAHPLDQCWWKSTRDGLPRLVRGAASRQPPKRRRITPSTDPTAALDAVVGGGMGRDGTEAAESRAAARPEPVMMRKASPCQRPSARTWRAARSQRNGQTMHLRRRRAAVGSAPTPQREH